MRLARYFGGDARSWLNLQTAHDLRTAEDREGEGNRAYRGANVGLSQHRTPQERR